MFNHKFDVIRKIRSKSYFWDDTQSAIDVDIDAEVWKKMIGRSIYESTGIVIRLMQCSLEFPDDEE